MRAQIGVYRKCVALDPVALDPVALQPFSKHTKGRLPALLRPYIPLLGPSTLVALVQGLSLSSPRLPCPAFCIYLRVEACLSPFLPCAVFALRLVGCDNVCCSSLVLSITAGSRRFPAVNSQSISVPFGLVNSHKKNTPPWHQRQPDRRLLFADIGPLTWPTVRRRGQRRPGDRGAWGDWEHTRVLGELPSGVTGCAVTPW
jgi:hypothetical protein